MSIDATRSLAARVAAKVELRDVRLWSAEVLLHRVSADDGSERFSFELQPEIEVQHEPGTTPLVVQANYSLALRAHSVDEDTGDEVGEPEDLASFQFRMAALFTVEEELDEPFSQDELIAFGQTTGSFALYPYAREYVADTTRRMGLPSLHMGLLRLNLESRTGD